MDGTSSPTANWLELNKAYWDERAPLHAESRFYDVPGFLAGNDTLRAFEAEQVGDVHGRSLLHLMCHIGLDTLSWARRGAQVTGLDFSAPALHTAADLARRAGIEGASFVLADINHASEALNGQSFEIVYTGAGVLQWLPDIDHWARTVASLVASGGFFYLADYHPFIDIVDDEVRALRRGYLQPGPFVEQESGSYTGSADTRANTSVKWTHHIGSIINALAQAGLRIEFLREYAFTDAPMFYGLERGEDGLWRFPLDRLQIPLMFSLRAAKDKAP